MRFLFLLLIIIPALEIGLFILSGKTLGLFPTVGIIVLTGIAGVYLAKRQGLETLRKVQRDLQRGQMPGDSILDGVFILCGGIFLVTPGFITDLAGFLLLIPATRKLFKPFVYRYLRRRLANRKTIIFR